ncbi:hypothetical protein DXZ75_35360 [Streptomyces sp. AcE210]|nr:hypothetical protein DXZ75_35360 [Streptomyces sp. AcE210]
MRRRDRGGQGRQGRGRRQGGRVRLAHPVALGVREQGHVGRQGGLGRQGRAHPVALRVQVHGRALG